MPLEIEAKFRVESHEPVRRLLLRHHATLIGEFDEINRFFDDAGRGLLLEDAGLRLRTSHDRATRQALHHLTYKGPRHPGAVKQREEIELTIDDPSACALLLGRLGFQEVLQFEKARQSWRIAECRVELDTLPLLGNFVEIEGPGERTVMALRQTLGLSDLPLIDQTYPALLDALHLPPRGRIATRR